jgi:hypothetical protein
MDLTSVTDWLRSGVIHLLWVGASISAVPQFSSWICALSITWKAESMDLPRAAWSASFPAGDPPRQG